MLNLTTRFLTTTFLFAFVVYLIPENQNKASNKHASANSRPREAGITALPSDVRIIEDLAYRDGKEKVWKLDLVMPKTKGEDKYPGLVFVHDGGWTYGDKRHGFFRKGIIEFAQKGYVCISVNYRNSFQAPFPGGLEDVRCAVRWFRAHADKYNVDPNRIGGFGNSAGAHVVCMLGLQNKKSRLSEDAPWKNYSSHLNAVAIAATPTDFLNWPGGYQNTRIIHRLLEAPGKTLEEQAQKASPINYVHQEAPPILMIHGTDDTLVDISQADRFIEALKIAGAEDVNYHRYEEAGHGVFYRRRTETHLLLKAFFERTLLNAETDLK